MKRAALRSLLVLSSAGLFAQSLDSLLQRVRNCHLPAEQRDELVAAFSARDYSRAEAMLERRSAAAGESPLAAELSALAGAIEFLHGRMAQAAEAFRHSDSRAPLDDRDRFTWAMALVKTADAGGARAQLTRLSAIHPSTPLYLYWLARLDYDQRRYPEAIEKLQRVIRLDPESSRAFDNLGLALDMVGRSDEAEPAFRKAVELNRKLPHPSAWPPHNLGALLLRLQQFKESENALRESLRYDPRLPIAHYHLGRVLDAEGRDDQAIDEYRAAATFEPMVIEALYSLGLVYRRHERKAEADAAFAEYKMRKAQSSQ